MKKTIAFLLIGAVRIYQRTLSPDHGWMRFFRSSHIPVCAFYPTCSEYAICSIEAYGPYHGILYTSRRLLSCHPWQKKHVDLP